MEEMKTVKVNGRVGRPVPDASAYRCTKCMFYPDDQSVGWSCREVYIQNTIAPKCKQDGKAVYWMPVEDTSKAATPVVDEALEASIKKYEDVLAGAPVHLGAAACPLCCKYRRPGTVG